MKKRFAALLLAIVMALGCLCGCGTSLRNVTLADYKDLTVATLGTDEISLAEVNYYLRNIQFLYELYYGYYYGDELWTLEYSDTLTYGEYIRSVMVNKVYQIHLLCSKAEELGVSLSEEDLAKVAAAVTEFMEESYETLLEAISLDEETLTEIYTNNALANRVWEAVVAGIDTEVDEEEIRQWEVMVVLLDETSEDYEAEEVKDALLAAMAEGVSLSDAATEYELSTTTYHVGSGDYESTFGTAAIALSTGESDAVYVESYGYWYVLECTDDYDEEAMETERESVLADRQDALFEEVYAQWLLEAPTFKLDENVLALLTFDTTLYSYSTTTAEETEEEELMDEAEEEEDVESVSETEIEEDMTDEESAVVEETENEESSEES